MNTFKLNIIADVKIQMEVILISILESVLIDISVMRLILYVEIAYVYKFRMIKLYRVAHWSKVLVNIFKL